MFEGVRDNPHRWVDLATTKAYGVHITSSGRIGSIPLQSPLEVYCDNKAAISISHNPVHQNWTKHVKVDRHFIKEKIEEGIIKITYVPTAKQTTDLLTKGLFRPVYGKLLDKLGMYNLYNPT